MFVHFEASMEFKDHIKSQMSLKLDFSTHFCQDKYLTFSISGQKLFILYC